MNNNAIMAAGGHVLKRQLTGGVDKYSKKKKEKELEEEEKDSQMVEMKKGVSISQANHNMIEKFKQKKLEREQKRSNQDIISYKNEHY